MIEQSVEDSLLALEELVQINLSITREKDLHLLLDKILTAARKLTAAEAGCIYILDRTKRYLHPEVVQGDYLQSSVVPLHKVDLRPERRPNMEEIAAYTALSGQIVNISDAYAYSGFNFDDLYHRDRLSGIRTRSLMVIPLTDYEGVSLGVMQLFNRRVSEKGDVEAFPAKLEAFVRAFAVQAVVVAENTRLLAENRNLIVQLDETNQVLQIENEELRNRMSGKLKVDEIVGQSVAMQQVFSLIEKIADSTATALIQGETGTGKELIAACIHRNGPHRDGPFIAQNCAALPEELLESELFGYRKGAFSGATQNKKGLIEAAEGGTLFLDEIGDMPLKLQAKLLRVLQEREVRPLGALESIPVNVRILAATHQDLPKLIAQGSFREDLFYRLNVFPIALPALRERREDIPALVHHFIGQFSGQYGKAISGIKPQVLDLIQSLPLPGNIRELRNIIERAVLLADQDGVIEPQHMPGYETSSLPVTPLEQELENGASLKDIMGRLEARVIARHLQRHNGNQTRTADALGVSRRSLVEKLGRYDLRESSRS
ncbi:sigma 54-interacting transcriptional regulator [Amphritea pacifica]|uniref:Sigma 54-interacting transcriptional regulator n=1 Tax=Amphritea pacifica TaxID=2811233 RepID=A0ABS2W5C5_9GAMM|nr:sigma 54-interacting transcriptional regulator [Amphritea pacifica]MBN0986918.1 sigma 54-interacting transcriptional regulator [Amphritea pacifica]MBN1005371.1 sigma 54-interacting transcriptional regulator [Amphritea pacifica]